QRNDAAESPTLTDVVENGDGVRRLHNPLKVRNRRQPLADATFPERAIFRAVGAIQVSNVVVRILIAPLRGYRRVGAAFALGSAEFLLEILFVLALFRGLHRAEQERAV